MEAYPRRVMCAVTCVCRCVSQMMPIVRGLEEDFVGGGSSCVRASKGSIEVSGISVAF